MGVSVGRMEIKPCYYILYYKSVYSLEKTIN